MKDYVVSSFYFGGNSDRKNQDTPVVTPFLFDKDSRNEPSEFEVFYVDNADEKERTYQYGFVLSETEVIEEWLYSKVRKHRGIYPWRTY